MKQKNKQHFFITGAVLAVIMTLFVTVAPIPVFAASGSVYTCMITRLYQHPVTGEIEDSGGESSYSIGQGMVEGCVYPTGILEVTDNGEYYLTIRMSLMDYTSGHSFQVQSWGDTGWSSAVQGITGTGSDENGTTGDICIQVPNENCIVRGTMYVEPMGRDVIWYMYPDGFQPGNNTDMAATMVTEEPETEAVTEPETEPQTEPETEAATEPLTQQAAPAPSQLPAATEAATEAATQETKKEAKKESEKQTTAIQLQTMEKEVATPAAESQIPDESDEISKAQGLSLSTAGDAADTETAGAAAVTGTAGQDAGTQILVNTLSIVIPGLILIAAACLAVYFLRKNWHKWGHAPDDEDDTAG